jgi:hypothetical protein
MPRAYDWLGALWYRETAEEKHRADDRMAAWQQLLAGTAFRSEHYNQIQILNMTIKG